MEIKEAIEYIKWMQEKFVSDKPREACDLAISALKLMEDFDLAIAALKKQEAIKSCTPPA